MGGKPKSIKEYCEILGVSPNASADEIRLAYVLLRREAQTSRSLSQRAIQEAYQALSGTGRPAGAERVAAAHPPVASTAWSGASTRRPVSALMLLGFLLVALVLVIGLYVWPMVGYRLRHFHPDESLVEARTGKPFGTIVEVQASHVFANGKIAPAYRVRLEPDGREAWYPESDVRYLCVRR